MRNEASGGTAAARGYHPAPWGGLLVGMSAFSCAILLGVTSVGLATGPRSNPAWLLAMVVMPLAVLAGALPFAVFGYEVTPDAIRVRRLGWWTELPLSDLRSVRVDPDAMKGSIRTFGNGGLFSFTGSYRNKRLGPYRALVTDPKRAVVLAFEGRVVVVTPQDPNPFAREVARMRGLPVEGASGT